MSELPKGWGAATLSTACALITDGTHHSPVNGPAGDFMYVTAKNIRPTGLDLSNVTYVDRYTHEKIYSRAPVRSGDILYIKDGATTGFSVVNDFEGEFSLLSSVALIRPIHDILDTKFLQKQFSSPDMFRRLVGSMSGSAIRRLTLTVLGKQTILIPPLAEQKRIVAKLDALTAKSARARAELARIDTLVSRYKQAVLAKAYHGDLTQNWRLQLGASGPEVRKLSDLLLAPIRNGLSVKGSDIPPGQPALRLSALRSQTVDMDDVRYLPIDDRKARPYILEKGDILVSRGNGTKALVGIASLVRSLPRATIFPDTAFRLRVHPADAKAEWLAAIWNSTAVRLQIEAAAKTTAGIWKISQKDLATFKLLVPSTIDEQHEIVRRIEAAFARIDRLAAEAKRALALLGKLDEAILARAFRGELVPQDPADEPASVLLERIRAERAAAPKRKPKANKRNRIMITAESFLEEKLKTWPDDGLLFQQLWDEFTGGYDDLKDAVFASISGEKPLLKQVFDENRSAMILRKYGQ